MDKAKSKPLALAGTAAIVAAIVMLSLGILGNIGVYTGAVEMMQQWHVFFSLSIGGIIAGMFEAAVITLLLMARVGLGYEGFENVSKSSGGLRRGQETTYPHLVENVLRCR